MNSLRPISNQIPKEESRVALARKEYARLCREIAELEARTGADTDMLMALRMCRSHLERELRRRGFSPAFSS